MKRTAMIGTLLIVGLVIGTANAQDAFPRTTLAEDCTATWCGYCPAAYDGLDVVHSTYDYSEFLSIRYYSSSGGGGLATPETDAAIAYYSIGGYPTVLFNGTSRIVGGSDTIAAGGPYLGQVASDYFKPSPIRITIDSFNTSSGAIQATVTMFSPTEALVDEHLRFILLEDDVTAEYTYVTRDIINSTISLTGQTNTATFNYAFTIDSSWNKDKLHAVVFVQRQAATETEPDKEIIQAVSTYPVPAYRVRAMIDFPQTQIGPSSGTIDGEEFIVMNVGLDDSYTIEVVFDLAPPGWNATFCDDEGHCFAGQTSFDLDALESKGFHVNMMPCSSGYARYHFEINSSNLAAPYSVPFTYLTADLDVLVVDDDGAESFEDYFTAALDTAELSYGVWDLASSKLTTEARQTFKTVVWTVGPGYPDGEDRDWMEAYLDAGNGLFLTGQDVGWGLNDSDPDLPFYRNYLHAAYLHDDTNLLYLEGVTSDPISHRMTLHIAGGDGANNQLYPSRIAPYDSDATTIFTYTGGAAGTGAIRSFDSTSGAHVVYLAFGFEAIDNPNDRALLMEAIYNWINQVIFRDGFESSGVAAWQ